MNKNWSKKLDKLETGFIVSDNSYKGNKVFAIYWYVLKSLSQVNIVTCNQNKLISNISVIKQQQQQSYADQKEVVRELYTESKSKCLNKTKK